MPSAIGCTKPNFASAEGVELANVVLDETVIQLDGQQYRLYATVNLEMNRFRHFRRY